LELHHFSSGKEGEMFSEKFTNLRREFKDLKRRTLFFRDTGNYFLKTNLRERGDLST